MGRDSRHKAARFPDPPVEPFAESSIWLQSHPQAILDDLEEATLMVRVGMAINALSTQIESGRLADDRKGGIRWVRRLASAINGAAITNEAVCKLLRHHHEHLWILADTAHTEEMKSPHVDPKCREKFQELRRGIEHLRQDQHPASQILKRARNKVGFHWDPGEIREAVRAFSRNKKIVWVEKDAEENVFHRLSFEVQAHILLPESSQADEQTAHAVVSKALREVRDAMGLVLRFFSTVTEGYAIAHRLEYKTRREGRTGHRRPPPSSGLAMTGRLGGKR